MTIVPGYEVGAQIYDGPSSQIYRARAVSIDGVADLPVILKVLKPAYPSPERLAWFKQEYDRLRSLDLPGVIKAHALESEQHRWILVLEDFGGESLDRLVSRGDLGLEELLVLAVAAADALGQVHQHSIIHKDVNPSNIVWNPSTGQLKIIDFGISTLSRARSVDNPPLRDPEVLQGTLAYISPEQTGRMNRPIDYRSDYYSLGVTLYELFTGALPFPAGDAMELVHCHIARRPAPPHERRPEVPRALSAVIMKLMEKTAEARYQSTYGLKADLLACLTELRERGAISDFAPGKHDVSERFQIPQKLYGRDREVEALVAAFERVAGQGEAAPGRPELVLLSGPSGVGKSALVQELYRPITRRGAEGGAAAPRVAILSGKFDQLQGGTPYSAVASAFRSLARQLLSESEERLAGYRRDLGQALGPNAQLIIDLVPEIELILGPQPPVQPLGPLEAQNRWDGVFQRFVQVLARPASPLVLFLDDLQRADPSSLRLLELLLTDDQLSHLLVLGAYRDNEVGPAHPLTVAVDGLLRAQPVPALVRSIRVGPLRAQHVAALVADTVAGDLSVAQPLAELLVRKTDGNPLFVSEFLKEIYHEGLLAFDRREGRWRADLARIGEKGITDNVVDLMIAKLRRLPAPAQEALRLAACLGGSFDIHTLARIEAQSAGDTFAQLLPALAEGFLLATSELVAVDAAAATSGAPLVVRDYKFPHDRVQQAAYALIDDAHKEAVHLRIARLLGGAGDGPAADRGDGVFALADHWNRAGALVTDDAERAFVAELNLAAGRRAKAALAYAAARAYLAAGVAALGDGAWTRHAGVALCLHRDLAEAESLNGHHERAESLARLTLERAGTALEKADVCVLLVSQYTMRARYDEAIQAARDGLSLIGVELQADDLVAAMEAAFAEVQAKMQGREIASLLDRPEMVDPWAKTATKLLLRVLSSTFYVSPVLYSLVIFKAVNLSLEYGHPPESCDLYSYYGHLLSGVRGEHRAGFDFGVLSLRLSERANRLDDKCRSSFIVCNFVLPWVQHVRAALPLNDAGYQGGLASGELQFAGYILIYKLFNKFYEGKPIAQVLADLPGYLLFNQKSKNQIATDIILGLRLSLSSLTGATDELSEAEFLAACDAHRSVMASCYFQILKTQALYLHGDPAGALAASDAAARLLPSIMGNIAVAEHGFYTALSLAAACPAEPGEERERVLARLGDEVLRIRGWAEGCPENFAHHHALVAAEHARVSGRVEAIDLYDTAIESARANGFAQDEALANELAGRFWLERRREKVAGAYVAEAYYAYQLWGAKRKVAELAARHPWLLLQDTTASLRSSVTTTAATATGQRAPGALDLSSVLKASQAISSEIVLDRLLTKLMGVVIENAGAQRGALILESGGDLSVQVEASVDAPGPEQPPVVTALQSTPLERCAAIAIGIVRYVGRTRESVILSDAVHEGAFTGDPYVVLRRPRSILCTPLVNQGQLLGILYVENNLSAGAFTPDRLEVLRLLSSQIAISIQNARLYNEMEHKVEERTEELRRKNGDLHAALQHLKQTQAQLIQSEKMASLGQLTAGIAHEIKNPLNFVNNFAELSVELASELAEELELRPDARLADVQDTFMYLKLNAQKIREHGERADNIVRSMMQHASGAAGERQPTEVNALVDEYVNLAYHGIRAQQRDLQVEIARDYHPETGAALMLPQEMGRVFVNLLNNAFYAVREKQVAGAPGYAAVVSVSTRRHGDHVVIRVQDNGPGIPAAVRNKIFVPFFTTKPSGSGTGLGLSMSYDIVVHGHRGTLAVESVEGQGATFLITLPV